MNFRIVLCVAVALTCACAATAAAGPHRDSDPTLAGLKVTAARDGTLTLSGQANSQAAADRTVAIARESDGVKRVESRLTIAHRTHR
jgi:osmotically-inducible protein OsmY